MSPSLPSSPLHCRAPLPCTRCCRSTPANSDHRARA
uniref:Uncharacterized protein n=1 Tax=Arundo donax TaxID=35708 RepID=A0A0A9SPX0_ARUDO